MSNYYHTIVQEIQSEFKLRLQDKPLWKKKELQDMVDSVLKEVMKNKVKEVQEV